MSLHWPCEGLAIEKAGLCRKCTIKSMNTIEKKDRIRDGRNIRKAARWRIYSILYIGYNIKKNNSVSIPLVGLSVFFQKGKKTQFYFRAFGTESQTWRNINLQTTSKMSIFSPGRLYLQSCMSVLCSVFSKDRSWVILYGTKLFNFTVKCLVKEKVNDE